MLTVVYPFFPSLVIFCWRCKPSLTAVACATRTLAPWLPRFRHTRFGLATGFVNMSKHARADFAGVSSNRQVAYLRLGDRIRGRENTNPSSVSRLRAGASLLARPGFTDRLNLSPRPLMLVLFCATAERLLVCGTQVPRNEPPAVPRTSWSRFSGRASVLET